MKLDDFVTGVVPTERRVRGFNILAAWMGFILVLATMSFGK
jgi:hypothetical protein